MDMTFEAWVTWLLLLVITIGAIDGGFRFQRGTRRSALRAYRNPALPATLRQIPLLLGLVGILCVPILVFTAPLVLHLPIGGGLPRHITAGLVFGAIGYVLLVCGLVLVLAYRPPDRFKPMWLKEDDEREGYYPPPPDWIDKVSAAIGILALVMGVAFWVAAAVAWLAPGLIGWQP